MDETSIKILTNVGIFFEKIDDLNGIIIQRDILISDTKYDEVKKLIPNLKETLKSSIFTSVQKTANETQKWPLLNLVRQIFHKYGFNMEPIRKSDGYTEEGKKKYIRFFRIDKIKLDNNTYDNSNNSVVNDVC